ADARSGVRLMPHQGASPRGRDRPSEEANPCSGLASRSLPFMASAAALLCAHTQSAPQSYREETNERERTSMTQRQPADEMEPIAQPVEAPGDSAALAASAPATTTPTTGLAPLTTRGLSIVLPAYNEETVIAATVRRCAEMLSALAPDYEIIVVDDGSRDRTGEIADELAAANPRVRVVHNRPNRGYGGALIAGFQAVSKPLTFFMDAD